MVDMNYYYYVMNQILELLMGLMTQEINIRASQERVNLNCEGPYVVPNGIMTIVITC